MIKRSEALAQRVEQGHNEMIALIESLPDEAWQSHIPGDSRPVGVIIHHVASLLPVETTLFQLLAAGESISGFTTEVVNKLNAQHANENAHATRHDTLALLKQNSAEVVAAIRALSDNELDQAAPVSLHWNAPLTTQYFIEEHPLSHSYKHAAHIREALDLTGLTRQASTPEG